MSNKVNPFKVVPEGGGWCVVIHHPQDDNDFVVADRSKMERDAHMICDALNGLIEAHVSEEKEYSHEEVLTMRDDMISVRIEYEKIAFKLGAERMREEAAVVCLETHTSDPDAAQECAARIRALPIFWDKYDERLK